MIVAQIVFMQSALFYLQTRMELAKFNYEI